ncbi:MAG: hypothetical protein ACK4F7_01645 [Inhella sp.]
MNADINGRSTGLAVAMKIEATEVWRALQLDQLLLLQPEILRGIHRLRDDLPHRDLFEVIHVAPRIPDVFIARLDFLGVISQPGVNTKQDFADTGLTGQQSCSFLGFNRCH